MNIPRQSLQPFFSPKTLLWMCAFGFLFIIGIWGVVGFIAIA